MLCLKLIHVNERAPASYCLLKCFLKVDRVITLHACTLCTSQKPPLFWYNYHSHYHNSWPLIWSVHGTEGMLLCHFIYIAHHAKPWPTVKGQHIGGACGTRHKEKAVYLIPCDVPQVAVDMATGEKLSRKSMPGITPNVHNLLCLVVKS